MFSTRLARCSKQPTVLVVGTGWAASYLLRRLNPHLCTMVVCSQRNHMLFTPLLPQTTTGTLEFRSVCDPVVNIQPALAKAPHKFFRTMVYDVDFDNSVAKCIAVSGIGTGTEPKVNPFDIKYDKLVLAHGARPNTFNIPGVEENTLFLREIGEARAIRTRIVQNMMTSKLPTTEPEEARRLLSIVVVGGGPTGIEFAADLADFIRRDVSKIDPQCDLWSVTVIEGGEILSSFDKSLRQFAMRRLQKRGVRFVKGTVHEVTPTEVILGNGERVASGLTVWSTGVGPSTLSKELVIDKTKAGRIAIDDELHALRNGEPLPNVFAIGDCAANVKSPLPTLAAVASRQGSFLADKLNAEFAQGTAVAGKAASQPGATKKKFVYRSLGSMISLGTDAALIQLEGPVRSRLAGWHALFLWRSAYFSMVSSFRARLYMCVNWAGSTIFGRDVTYVGELSETKLWRSLAKEGASREVARRRMLNRVREADKPSAAAAPAAAAEKPKP